MSGPGASRLPGSSLARTRPLAGSAGGAIGPVFQSQSLLSAALAPARPRHPAASTQPEPGRARIRQRAPASVHALRWCSSAFRTAPLRPRRICRRLSGCPGTNPIFASVTPWVSLSLFASLTISARSCFTSLLACSSVPSGSIISHLLKCELFDSLFTRQLGCAP